MNVPSLKQSLARWIGFQKIERDYEPRKTKKAAARIEKLLEAVQPKTPAAYDLQALHRRVAESWHRDRSLSQLAPRDLRRLPWVLFYPEREGNRIGGSNTAAGAAGWLGAEPAVVTEYRRRWLAAGRRTRSVLPLFHEFLRVYPVGLPTFDGLCRLLRKAVKGGSSPPPPSLQRWRKRFQELGILDTDGSRKFVRKLVSAADSPEKALRQTGLDAEFARCGFLESGICAYLPDAESLLRGNCLGSGPLDRLLILLTCDGQLRFDDRTVRSEIAQALLGPFVERAPNPEIRERLQPFFLRHFGDPRLPSGKSRWPRVPDPVRRVVIRWLNERALEQFFLLVQETALDRHWRYREAFWRAFLPLDPDICFALGRHAKSILQRKNAVSDEFETTAMLKGAQGNQSVLLLQLPGVMTVAEWSHNGTCRFWLDGNSAAPKLYEQEYSRFDLVSGEDFSQRHDGNLTGRWQDQIMDWLRDNRDGHRGRSCRVFPRPAERSQRKPRSDHISRIQAAETEKSLGKKPQADRAKTLAQLVDPMAKSFAFEPTPGGLTVRMGSDPPLPVSEWTAHASDSSGAGTLIRLRDDGSAVEHEEGRTLSIPWPSVAGLTQDELRRIELPDAVPYALEIVASGAIHDPNFDIHYGFRNKGRRVLGTRRQGAWLRVGDDDFLLLDPLYTITDAIDRFQRAENADLETRMLQWGRIAEILPEDAVVDGKLRALHIVVASSFELAPFLDDDGEPNFDPIVGRRETRITDAEDEEQVFTRSLPSARQQEFARRFRGLSQVKHRYAAGGGAYVVLTPEVERLLGSVRRAQTGTAGERRDFLRDVPGYLRGALDGAGDEQIDVDSIFSDLGLSERVRGIGIWIEKPLPWIQQAAEPWLPPEKLGLRIGSQIVHLESDDLPDLLERVRTAVERCDPTVRVGDDSEIPADPAAIEAIEELVRRRAPVARPKPDRERPRPGKGAGPDGSDRVLLVADNLEALQFHRERRKRTPGITAAAPNLRTTLFPHQQDCLAWLRSHWDAGSWGVLLADDMGLGKTLEALAFLSCLKSYALTVGLAPRPLLVVAPTGLLRNWRDEHDQHLSEAGLGRAVEAHGAGLRQLRTGANEAGNELRADPPLPKLKVEALSEADWVLTTYETLRDYQHSFGRVHWRAAVFDEAQKIKNPSARITDAALAMNVDFALLMTGTPVENRPADIWSMLDRIEPGKFATLKDFSRRYEADDEDGQSALAELHRELTVESPPVLMLRRLKEDHLSGLPDKHIHRHVVEMPPLQAERYEQIVLQSRQGGRMLQSLQDLRSISLHPAAPADSDPDRYIQESARLSETFSILDKIANLHEKVLLFVELREMQDFLIVALRQRFRLPNDVLVVNGAVSGRTRKARVDAFQNRQGFDVMVLSPRAGGVGLTLTAANHVIHLTRWWNPAVEDQCTDRVFRIGQRRLVHVYLPLARHPRFGDYSFDLKLDSLMERKRERNRRVLAPTTATEGDMNDLYHSTMTMALGGEDSETREARADIDLQEPEAFEIWALQQLAEAGYDTRRTPRSRDRGADGIAISRIGDDQHTIILQCKHTQPDASCGRAAVEEVLRAIPHYEIRGEPIPMVVTNAAGFTASARRLARRRDVLLVDRHELPRLRAWKKNRNRHIR